MIQLIPDLDFTYGIEHSLPNFNWIKIFGIDLIESW